MELTYTKKGDYYYPDIVVSEEEKDSEPLGKYGRMRLDFLEKHQPGTYTSMLLTGRLSSHLREIDKTANERLERMMPQLTEAQGVTESLKASDPMKWVGLMSNCKAQAEEIIFSELIYN